MSDENQVKTLFQLKQTNLLGETIISAENQVKTLFQLIPIF